MRSKAQITVFIILGLIIAFIFIFLILFVQKMSGKGSAQNFEQMKQFEEDKKVVDNYLKDCFEHAVKLNLMEIGLQGGVFYRDQIDGVEGIKYEGPNISAGEQYGKKVVPFWYNGTQGERIYNLTYALEPRDKIFTAENYGPRISSYTYDLNSPLHYIEERIYPFGDYEINGNTAGLFTLGFLPLCMSKGANAGLIEGAEYSCPKYATVDRLTIQYILAKKITKDTMACFREEKFRPRIQGKLRILDEEKSSSVVLFGEDNLYVQMNMPVEVVFDYIMGEDNPVFKESEFILDLPIRLKYIYELMYWILEQEAGNIFFNMHNVGIDNKSMPFCFDFIKTEHETKRQVDCFREGMTFEIIKNACEYSNNKSTSNIPCDKNANKSTFLIVRDELSYNFDNQPFMFVTVIGNRAPVIDVINFKKFDENDTYYRYLNEQYDLFEDSELTTPNNVYNRTKAPIFNNGDNFDIILDWNEMLYIIPMAIDPDEDFDYKNLTLMEKKYEYFGWNNTVLMNSSFYKYGALGKTNHHTISGKDVNMSLNMSHVGDHQIDLKVYDESDNVFTRAINLQVRCFDQLRGFDSSETKNVNLKGRWGDDGVWYSNSNKDLKGDYNFSALNYSEVDLNDTNDCCNESGGFVFSDDGHKCDTCHRCVNGNCVVNETKGNDEEDCGFCRSCNADGNCLINDSNNASCTGQLGDWVCCNGNCLNLSNPSHAPDLDDFDWSLNTGYNGSLMNATYPNCWTDEKVCIKKSDVIGIYDILIGNYTYSPKINTCTISETTRNCLNGRCIS